MALHCSYQPVGNIGKSVLVYIGLYINLTNELKTTQFFDYNENMHVQYYVGN
jgi:hypothetical protein